MAPKMMENIKRAGTLLKSRALGPARIHNHYDIGLQDPQAEVAVWLCGPDGNIRDVTYLNVMACAHPFTIGIGLEDNCIVAAKRARLSLQFHERTGRKQLLGEIGLVLKDCILVTGGQLFLFAARNCRNYCLPKLQLWAYDLRCAYEQWNSTKRGNSSQILPTRFAARCLSTFYTCPRPIVLVSVVDGNVCNIFPMDLIGPVSAENFCLALHNTSSAVPLLERSRRVALSSIPIEQKSLAYSLGKNHSGNPFSQNQIPFGVVDSVRFKLPVPRFSLRVREMQIVTVRPMGSHKLFLCNMVEDHSYASGLQLCVIHGLYQVWRQQRQKGILMPSVRE